MSLIRSFDAVWRPDARVLILGSAPSALSLEQGFYFAHPRNAFWPILGEILGEAMPDGPEGKAALLIRHNIALWDVIGVCARTGSLDAAITHAVPNDIAGLVARLPHLRRVLVAGTTAYQLYRRYFGHLPVEAVRLPSTSPANTVSFAAKLTAWRAALMEDAR